ncbi:putative nuclease HARBI1 [Nylanderia fulva]|uniref:putative nuclease HARBI1 n=2 Tax=Nylanderia fulva TaxID=613905 RepID=UPI0010FAD26B|nr:putative nuclease HARBI1 [Nylanderia fulva]XP_029162077.1 putative nuclease HARBI1 [Nylanderia fulva]XP_029175029.1 putative nuclease HARBI1 [Nylanderia fulva]XP_029179198.1 putative nuclease HARBI1 [Nylanderia fulva]
MNCLVIELGHSFSARLCEQSHKKYGIYNIFIQQFLLQILIALNFIASGSYQKRVGQDYLLCVSQPTVSKILSNVVNALNILMQQWIQFPIKEGEIQHVKERFWARTQFPGVIGAIDGTHIAIVPPKAERQHLYINRKLYHSLNVLIISDYEGKILTVNAAHGGRTHDARVWRASLLSNHLQEMYTEGRRDAWLLGDSAYPLLPYLMTPKLNVPEGTPAARYTQHHVRARSCVERCIGVLKGRWRCLRKERALHYEPEVAARIVNAACVLHNIAIRWRLPEPELYYDVIDLEVPRYQEIAMENGNEVRQRIINTYFQNRHL